MSLTILLPISLGSSCHLLNSSFSFQALTSFASALSLLWILLPTEWTFMWPPKRRRVFSRTCVPPAPWAAKLHGENLLVAERFWESSARRQLLPGEPDGSWPIFACFCGACSHVAACLYGQRMNHMHGTYLRLAFAAAGFHIYIPCLCSP